MTVETLGMCEAERGNSSWGITLIGSGHVLADDAVQQGP